MKKFIFILIIVSLLLTAQCLAIRVSGKHTVDFEPNLEKSFRLCITILKYDREAHLSINEKNPLAKYVTIDDEILEFDMPSTQCTKYHLKLPSEVDVFGKKVVYVNVKEINPDGQKGAFAVVPAMNHPLVVKIPYPGKYISGKLLIEDVEEGKVVPIVLELFSKGLNTVETAKSVIKIFDSNNNSITILNPPIANNIIPGNSTKMELGWNTTGQRSGTFRAEVETSYENRTMKLDKEFHIGSLNVDILDHTKNITNGSIKPIEITVQSEWTDSIGEVYLNIELNGKKTKTDNKKIKPWSPTKFVGYIDATKFPVGGFNLSVTAHYEGKTTEYTGEIKVIPHPEEGFDIELTHVLIVIIILIVALNIVWFVFYRKKNNKKSSDHTHQVTLNEVNLKNEKK